MKAMGEMMQTIAVERRAEGGQYLTFSLAGEHYGVDILAVREIRGWARVTRVPQSPPFVLGVLNLRGAIVPIMDLRLRFGLPEKEREPTTVTIIVAIDGRHFGMVVDGVSDVLDVDAAAISGVPDFGQAIDNDYLSGLAPYAEGMAMLLDVRKLLRTEDWKRLDDALPERQPAEH